MKLGIIARSDNTGLGNQTRELVKMLNPKKILLINSSFFNNNIQHPEWYQDYEYKETVRGFPKTSEILDFLKNLDVVLSCETFYDSRFIDIANTKNVKTILQYNYELLEHAAKPNLTPPTVFLAPSLWCMDKMVKLFGNKSKIIYLSPPTSPELFEKQKNINFDKSHNRILHIAGKRAAKDRNGTQTVLDMLKYSKRDYELVITTQTELDIKFTDSRLTILYDNVDNRSDLYSKFDCLVLPRRYAGLCLPMNEALLSGLPVFMTDISPNNSILPKDWLVYADKIDRFRGKALVDVYGANPRELGKLVDSYINLNHRKKLKQKEHAYQIGMQTFSPDILKQKYLDIIFQTMS